jgi:hypothetical protein
VNTDAAAACATTRATYHRALLNEALSSVRAKLAYAISADERRSVLDNAAGVIAYHEAELDKALADEAERGAA